MRAKYSGAIGAIAVLFSSGCSGLGDEAAAAPEFAPAAVDVIGPIAQKETSHAFGGAAYTLAPEDLSAIGYVEEEFLISGLANVYEWNEPGAATVRTADAPYTTRVLVRRPADAADFSGDVMLEMLNPSNLFDLNIGWALQHDELVRSGDAWVGVTAKPIAVETLQIFDPVRYAKLSWGNPLAADDPANCTELRGDTTQATENGLVWDINTQAAQWVRSRDPSNPFLFGDEGGRTHPVQHVYGWGYSQTGSFLYTYINAIQPLVVAEHGRSMFDGYVVAVSGGPGQINQCAAPIAADDPRREIRDAGTPVMHVMSQSDYLLFSPRQREDGDTPGDRYRHYDLAGAGHATPDELFFAARSGDIERGSRTPPVMDCNEGPRSRFPSRIGFNAIYRNLKSWVKDGVAPPPSQAIVVKDGAPVLDEHGNVTGGVRSPYLDVPTSQWMGNSTGESFCRIAGHEIPFSVDKLKALYPSEAAYEAAFRKSVDDLVAGRFITPEDGEALKQGASETKVR